MQGLAISDLSFCELATENHLDKIMGGQNYIGLKLAVYVSKTEPKSLSKFLQIRVNFPATKPVLLSAKNIKFKKLVIKHIKHV